MPLCGEVYCVYCREDFSTVVEQLHNIRRFLRAGSLSSLRVLGRGQVASSLHHALSG